MIFLAAVVKGIAKSFIGIIRISQLVLGLLQLTHCCSEVSIRFGCSVLENVNGFEFIAGEFGCYDILELLIIGLYLPEAFLLFQNAGMDFIEAAEGLLFFFCDLSSMTSNILEVGHDRLDPFIVVFGHLVPKRQHLKGFVRTS
jgi:hypothetical protein